jgi:hypothetical protein
LADGALEVHDPVAKLSVGRDVEDALELLREL